MWVTDLFGISVDFRVTGFKIIKYECSFESEAYWQYEWFGGFSSFKEKNKVHNI